MSSFMPKVYVVQRYDRHGLPGEVIGVKLTWDAAHVLAKNEAPARVWFAKADKTVNINAVVHSASHPD